jgi:calcineurin-like phosphoesterase family protein
MDYFLSDSHFEDEDIWKMERTQFLTQQAHDEAVAASLKRISKHDTLYHLGDIGNLDRIAALPCRKILIKGNHDTRSKEAYSSIFDEIHDVPLRYSSRIVLSHKPTPVEQNVLNIHGHFHTGLLMPSANYFCISWNYTQGPVTEKDIARRLGAIPKKIGFGEEWYQAYVDEKRTGKMTTDIPPWMNTRR